MKTLDAAIAGLDRIVIVGLGLIGGSIARGLTAADFGGETVGLVADPQQAEYARALALVERVEVDPETAVAGSDLVVVAVPLGAVAGVLAAIRPALSARAIITDVGSAKQCVVDAAAAELGADADRFVPGHPISGTEENGLEAGFASLFEHRRVVLTPGDDTNSRALAVVEGLWRTLGARVRHMSAVDHDRVLAATSHLPHALAFTLVDCLADMDDHDAIFDFAAGGFSDFTRIAASDPIVWRDIFSANRASLVPVLDRYLAELTAVRDAVADNDTAWLADLIGRAKKTRDGFANRAFRSEDNPV